VVVCHYRQRITEPGSWRPGCPNKGAYTYSGITDSNGYNTYVINDMWNPPGTGHPQTIYANNPGNWKVVSDQPTGNSAVLSYPDVQQVLTQTNDTPALISRFQAIFSDYKESMPSGGDNEAAYDIWLGRSASPAFSQEIMIWADDHRTNPPPGKIVAKPVIYGIKYTIWKSGGAIFIVRDGNALSSVT